VIGEDLSASASATPKSTGCILVEKRQHIADRSVAVVGIIGNSGKRQAKLDCNDRQYDWPHLWKSPEVLLTNSRAATKRTSEPPH
jgi:hypothetical protein